MFLGKDRVAIVGTAQSWSKCPFDDPGLFVMSLNDAYLCRDGQGRGLPRVDAWWELHPFSKFVYRKRDQKLIFANQIPPGHYVRPDGHIEWLKEQAKTIPVFLQDEPPAGWAPNAQRFPIEYYDAQYGTYWASGPSYMIAWAIEQGFKEIQVWGIHLATEQEYVDQRPNVEHLLGIARGRGIKVVMADESPVMKHGWKYGYEPKPTKRENPLMHTYNAAHQERAKLLKTLAAWPRWKSKAASLDRLRRLEAIEQDCMLQMQQARQSSTVVAA
jgi:hypothetical protein